MEAQLELLYRYQFLMQRAAQYSILAGHRLGAGVGSGAMHQVAQELLLDQATLRALVQQANARQYLERLAASQAAVPSPRAGSAEEELALQALQHLKDDPSSEKKANPNGAGLAAPFDAIAAAATGRDVTSGPAGASSDPSSQVSDGENVAPAQFPRARETTSQPPRRRAAAASFELDHHPPGLARGYVKRHENWKRKATRPERGGANSAEAEDASAAAAAAAASGGSRRASPANSDAPSPEMSSDEDDELKGGPGHAGGAPGVGGSGVPPRRDELAKEWAALTTWIRMNLHQARTARRKVLFVGHHPRLNPVDGVASRLPANYCVNADAKVGEKRKASGSDKDPDSRELLRLDKRGRQMSARHWADRRAREEDDFVFVLNPELDWSDIGHDTRVRMKTLVAETIDIFRRKYHKRKPEEWERKIQKYKPPGSDKTFNIPLGRVVRGIQDAYFRFNPDEKEPEEDGEEGEKAR